MLVHQIIASWPEERVAIAGEKSVTYGQLRRFVEQYRNCFFQEGVRSGDTVGLLARNCVEYIYSYFAIVSLGAIVVPINYQLTGREIAFILTDARIKILVTMAKVDLPTTEQVDKDLTVKQLVIDDFNRNLPVHSIVIPEHEEVDAVQPCVIIYTSGTTGNPKGAVLSHKNLLSNAEAVRNVLQIDVTDNVLCVLPMYHCFAWTCAVVNPLLCGAAIVILDGFTPKETLATLGRYAVTVMYGVPPMYSFFVRAGTPAQLSGVRCFVSGGASLPRRLAEQFHQNFGIPLLEGYGLSEASPVVTLNPLAKVKIGSIGQPLPGLEVKIINAQNDVLAKGMVGELIVKGASVMMGYLNMPAESARVIRDSWLYTGDLAYQDNEGYIYIVDRLKDMIITNGENIYPREIEEVLYTYPGVEEVAVVGTADELRGQYACAYLVLVEGQELDRRELKNYLLSNLAAFKIPKEFIIVDALPKTQTGKILKRVLSGGQSQACEQAV